MQISTMYRNSSNSAGDDICCESEEELSPVTMKTEEAELGFLAGSTQLPDE